MLGVSPSRDEQEPMSQLVDVEMIFAISPPVAERTAARLTRSRRLAGAAAAVVGAALVTALLLLS
jgi:hypothetical protein